MSWQDFPLTVHRALPASEPLSGVDLAKAPAPGPSMTGPQGLEFSKGAILAVQAANEAPNRNRQSSRLYAGPAIGALVLAKHLDLFGDQVAAAVIGPAVLRRDVPVFVRRVAPPERRFGRAGYPGFRFL